MASGAPGTRATAKSSTRPPVFAGPMLRQRALERSEGSTTVGACATVRVALVVHTTRKEREERRRIVRITSAIYQSSIRLPSPQCPRSRLAFFLLFVTLMRWTPGGRGDIEDMRGRSGGLGTAGLGIGGFLVLLVLSWATGTNLFSLLGTGDAGPSPTA